MWKGKERDGELEKKQRRQEKMRRGKWMESRGKTAKSRGYGRGSGMEI
jgi:hypothetical protein